MEERPTHRVYIEILTCHAIILHLEDSRSHETEAEAKRGQRQGARPVLLGARPLLDFVLLQYIAYDFALLAYIQDYIVLSLS